MEQRNGRRRRRTMRMRKIWTREFVVRKEMANEECV